MTQHADLAPIALFVYNRPEHTRQTIEALKANFLAEKSDLIIFSDAPKVVAHAEAVENVRRIANEIDGFKSVQVIERESNWGLARSIIDGVTTTVKSRGRVIVLEDDLLTSPYFLTFMNDALDRYETDQRVMQIAGYMFPVEIQSENDALFLPFTSSWGWATWKRAWDMFDPDAKSYSIIKDNQALKRQFDLDGSYPYFKMLESQMRGEIDSWAIRWYLSAFVRQGLTLYPTRTLVANIGFDGSGTHCGFSSVEQMSLNHARVINFPETAWVKPIYQSSVFEYLSKNNRNALYRLGARIWHFLKV